MSRTLIGIVSSDKADKTIVVTVQTRKTHPLYQKQYTATKRFMAHDAANEAKVGDKVAISETRPLSARKHYTLDKIVERAAIRAEDTVESLEAPTEPAPEKEPKPAAEKPARARKTAAKEKS